MDKFKTEARDIVENAIAWAGGDERAEALADVMTELVAASLQEGFERGRRAQGE